MTMKWDSLVIWTTPIRGPRRASKNREMLKKQITEATGVNREDVISKEGKIFVLTGEESINEAAKTVRKHFGISYFTKALSANSKEEITEKILEEINSSKEASFDLKPLSRDVKRDVPEIKRKIVELTELVISPKNGAKMYLERAGGLYFLCTEREKGPGGRALGSESPLVSILNDSEYSFLSSWSVMRKGHPVIPVFFDFHGRQVATRVIREIFSWSIGAEIDRKAIFIPYSDTLDEISQIAGRRVCHICRRIMYLVSERLARREGAEGIVVGEILGEKGVKLDSIRIISRGISLPIIRPLLAMEEEEISRIMKSIVTMNLNTLKELSFCRSRAAPRKLSPRELERLEERVNLTEKIEVLLSSSEEVSFKDLS